MENQQPKNEKREIMISPEVFQADLSMGLFGSMGAFLAGQRMAGALVTSTLVPKDYHDNLGNCMIALDIASRLKVSPFLVMQNLYIIGGRPAWYTQYVIAVIERSGKYKGSLRYELTGKGETLACYAWNERHDGSKDIGPTITMAMAKAEGWLGRSGSKWQTMPEVMIRYRAASFFGRLFCPDALLGIYTDDEVREINGQFEEDRYPTDAEAQGPIGIPAEFSQTPPAGPVDAPAAEPTTPDAAPDSEPTTNQPAAGGTTTNTGTTVKPRAGQQQFAYGGKPNF